MSTGTVGERHVQLFIEHFTIAYARSGADSDQVQRLLRRVGPRHAPLPISAFGLEDLTPDSSEKTITWSTSVPSHRGFFSPMQGRPVVQIPGGRVPERHEIAEAMILIDRARSDAGHVRLHRLFRENAHQAYTPTVVGRALAARPRGWGAESRSAVAEPSRRRAWAHPRREERICHRLRHRPAA